MWNLILVGVLRGIFKIQVCFVPQKSIFDLFGQKWPARMVTVKDATVKYFHNLSYLIFFIIISKKSWWFERQLFTVGELVIFDAIRGPDDARCKWRATTVTSISENEKTQKEFDQFYY